MITAYLEASAFALAAIYNAILTFETYEMRREVWRIAASAVTTMALVLAAYYRVQA